MLDSTHRQFAATASLVAVQLMQAKIDALYLYLTVVDSYTRYPAATSATINAIIAAALVGFMVGNCLTRAV